MWEGLLQDVNVPMPTVLKEKLVPHLQNAEFMVINFISGHKKVKH